MIYCSDFNPHFRKGSDDFLFLPCLLQYDFNPHFHKGSDCNRTVFWLDFRISIHTSTREVTVVAHWQKCYTIFQSTLPQGKWLCICHSFILAIYFNPHFRKGSDGSRLWKAFQTWFQSTLPQGKWRAMLGGGCKDMDISIHTSAREVTGGKVFIKRPLRNFNPHFRKGSDHSNLDGLWPYGIFQSTLPQGKWRRTVQNGGAACQLQSTLPQGKWLVDHALTKHCLNISIHTSAREVTPCSSSICVRYWDFNPHFRKGSDEMSVLITYLSYISIHTSARKVTK